MSGDFKSEFERLKGMPTPELLRELAAGLEKRKAEEAAGKAVGTAMMELDIGVQVRCAMADGFVASFRGSAELMGPNGPSGNLLAAAFTMGGTPGRPTDEYLIVTSSTERDATKPGVENDPAAAVRVVVYKKDSEYTDRADRQALAVSGRQAIDKDDTRCRGIRDDEPLVSHALIALAGFGRKLAARADVFWVGIGRIVPGDQASGYCLVVAAAPGADVPEAVTVEVEGRTFSVPVRLKL